MSSFSIQTRPVFNFASVSKSNDYNRLCSSCNVKQSAQTVTWRQVRVGNRMIITMRDRSKNRKPLQKGRNLSIEAIQTVQALKRVKNDDASLHRVFATNFSRLLRLDMIAVLKELIRQNQCSLALKAFADVQKEHWYKPKVLLYAELISVLGRNEMFDELELVFRKLEDEISLEPDIVGFNAVLESLLSFGIIGLAMDCFYLMKSKGCEPDRSTFKILFSGLESKGETSLAVTVRKEAEKIYGSSLEFLEENEDEADNTVMSL
ncbi:protein THYLAKOID ASSEMBLY 8-like, chloroplastic [Apium graveolens]|uniref:protein THYLAKOID ASSEMBLY 8-like, chloroplastic n=1 Tax=Apium graveolens TaxID=4045 RepID=UPI003D7AD6AD